MLNVPKKLHHVTCDIWLEFVYTEVVTVVGTGKMHCSS